MLCEFISKLSISGLSATDYDANSVSIFLSMAVLSRYHDAFFAADAADESAEPYRAAPASYPACRAISGTSPSDSATETFASTFRIRPISMDSGVPGTSGRWRILKLEGMTGLSSAWKFKRTVWEIFFHAVAYIIREAIIASPLPCCFPPDSDRRVFPLDSFCFLGIIPKEVIIMRQDRMPEVQYPLEHPEIAFHDFPELLPPRDEPFREEPKQEPERR
jgi:hypothetical protein